MSLLSGLLKGIIGGKGKVRVRFAPSPTGDLHVGGLRTALYNELFARHHGGTLVLRIEDTDRTRMVEGGVENIIRTLAQAGIEPEEGPALDASGKIVERGNFGPYVQSARQDIYDAHIQILLDKNLAYRCFCTPEKLKESRALQIAEKRQIMYDKTCRDLSEDDVAAKMKEGQPSVVRLRVPDGRTIAFDDVIRGTIEIKTDTIDDQVLQKSDGYPTYHLANVVDDHRMGITHVIRGEEWVPSTPKHVLLYEAFGWDIPAFAHLPLLLNPDKSKLSKRQGDVAVEDYLAKGYLPEALVNFVALLGWNPSDSREIYTKDELVSSFDLSKVNKGGAVFNTEKLDWMNREYLKVMPDASILAAVLPILQEAGIVQGEAGALKDRGGNTVKDEFVEHALSLEKERVVTLREMPEAIGFLFSEGVSYDDIQLYWKKSTPEIAKDRLEGLEGFVASLPDEDFDEKKVLEEKTIAFVAEKEWTNAESLWPLRVALTGRERSPSPFEVMWVLGKERSLKRIRDARSIL